MAIKEATKVSVSRLWEIDTVRGIAIILMVYYHLTWDLNFYGVLDLIMTSGPWSWFARFIATMFITVMGISLVLSYNRAKDRVSSNIIRHKILRRGGKVFGFGLLISLGTYFFLDFQGAQGFVIFGILHVIGFSIAAAYPFLPEQRRWLALVAGLVFIGAGIYVDGLASHSPWLIPLGVKQYFRLMVDYYPILPWYGVALIGTFLGNTLYRDGKRQFSLPDLSQTPFTRILSFLGRHSLLIYIIHQPILIAILFSLGIATM